MLKRNLDYKTISTGVVKRLPTHPHSIGLRANNEGKSKGGKIPFYKGTVTSAPSCWEWLLGAYGPCYTGGPNAP